MRAASGEDENYVFAISLYDPILPPIIAHRHAVSRTAGSALLSDTSVLKLGARQLRPRFGRSMIRRKMPKPAVGYGRSKRRYSSHGSCTAANGSSKP